MQENLSIILQLLTVACLMLILTVLSLSHLSKRAVVREEVKEAKTPDLDNAIVKINNALANGITYLEIPVSKMPMTQFETLIGTLFHYNIEDKDVKQTRSGEEILTLSFTNYKGSTVIEKVSSQKTTVIPAQQSQVISIDRRPVRNNRINQSRYPADMPPIPRSLTNVLDFKQIREFGQKKEVVKSNSNNLIEIDFANRKRKS